MARRVLLPTDLVATALATCMATVIGIKARQKGIAVEGMTVEIEKHMSEDAPGASSACRSASRCPYPKAIRKRPP
ncbi:MAG: hypothetical protein R3F31_18830 [Verrucomicrobiales bacterium]